MKIKQIVNSLPPVFVIPTESGAPLIVPLPTATTPTRNASKVEGIPPIHGNVKHEHDPQLLTPHGKQNKINVHLSEPILFVTAPQDVDYTQLSKVTQPVKLVPNKLATTASPVVVNFTNATTPKTPVVTSTLQPTVHTTNTQKSSLLKKLAVGSGNLSRENSSKETSSKEITRESSSTGSSTTEKISNDVRKTIRRPPPVGTLFRKRLPTPQTTTEVVKPLEDTTVSKENELAELKLYTESPLELQKVGSVKLNEIPPTSKINTNKPLKDNNVHEKELSDNSVYRKEELKLKYTSTTSSPVKYSSTPASVKLINGKQRHPEVEHPVKHIQSSPQPVKHVTSGTNTAYTPNIDLIIDYTSSTRKATTSTTTEQSIQVKVLFIFKITTYEYVTILVVRDLGPN